MLYVAAAILVGSSQRLSKTAHIGMPGALNGAQAITKACRQAATLVSVFACLMHLGNNACDHM